MLTMPILETARLTVRPFIADDLVAIHQILDVELAAADFGSEGALGLEERRRWLDWTIAGYTELAKLYQPPYGDRAVVSRADGALLGACGFTPALAPFGQIPALRAIGTGAEAGFFSPEFGLYYAISPRHQRQGYATEAARALVAYGFESWHLRRLVATTTHANVGSIGVMAKLGMTVGRNELATPPWLQVVGTLDNPALPHPRPGTYAPDGARVP